MRLKVALLLLLVHTPPTTPPAAGGPAAAAVLSDSARKLLVDLPNTQQPPPADLMEEYVAFLAASKSGDGTGVKKFLLDGIPVTTEPRPDPGPGRVRGEFGNEPNIPFMRGDHFWPGVTSVARGVDTCNIYTGTSLTSWVLTETGKWRVYAYSDFPPY